MAEVTDAEPVMTGLPGPALDKNCVGFVFRHDSVLSMLQQSQSNILLMPVQTEALRDLGYGLISTGVPTGASFQISSISESVTAMQPSVQSYSRWAEPMRLMPFGSP
jgi:hypothetical protein